jgi:hypothetical protein
MPAGLAQAVDPVLRQIAERTIKIKPLLNADQQKKLTETRDAYRREFNREDGEPGDSESGSQDKAGDVRPEETIAGLAMALGIYVASAREVRAAYLEIDEVH